MADKGYELIDAGGNERLERFGGVAVRRPAPMAGFSKKLGPEEWAKASLVFSKDGEGKGGWSGEEGLPEPWVYDAGPVSFGLAPSGQGQLGVFPEQLPNWLWINEFVKSAGRDLKILNAFAYTGGSTISASEANSEVVHLDASKGSVNMARRNAEISGKDGNVIRWIVEDAMKFMKREIKRGNRYDALILDPPAFGRGKGGSTWKLERDMPELLSVMGELLSDAPAFALLTCHVTGWQARDLESALSESFMRRSGKMKTGELDISSAAGSFLPLGLFARWVPH